MDMNNKRILIIKQSSLGDIVHTLPVAHALKRCYPSCAIGWIVQEGYASLLAGDPAVDVIHPVRIPSTSDPNASWLDYVRALTAMVRQLRQLRAFFRKAPYDLVLDLHASFRSGLFALMNPGGQRIGFADAKELNTLFQHQLLPRSTTSVHAVDGNLLFADFLGCEAHAEDFHLRTSRADEEQADRFLRNAGIEATVPLAYMNPLARWESKCWFASRWSALCDRLMDTGIQPILAGGPSDQPYLDEIAARMVRPAVIAAGRLDLNASVALMKKAAVYVGVDTGPLHMAAMVGTPVVALFGPTHPERVGPYRVQSTVVRDEGLDCLCCRKRTCAHMRCMENISVATVQQAILATIRNRGQQ
ncbi:glycosyltransferase family 9 protein [Desulfobulbus alkaliphilus]|uniref:glycosyltransferase family 9 protein n=1 Tax=Desulfobulbus alkaliphilus TaxID=869814 RepID=UPI00196405D2|nr:glycosyltransferase family 9 protein [Desulfobulbus alkaliphilus]MBM9537969.1 glycosyltransferase family 9 protein [Desulfobulbus alkaliphilus]